MKKSALFSLLVTTFVGGMTGYLTTAFASGIPAGFAWKATVISAILAGLAALAHLYQDPAKGPATIGEQIDNHEFLRLPPDAKKAVLKSLDLTSTYPVAIVTDHGDEEGPTSIRPSAPPKKDGTP